MLWRTSQNWLPKDLNSSEIERERLLEARSEFSASLNTKLVGVPNSRLMNVIILSGLCLTGRDAEQTVPESLDVSEAAYAMQKSTQFLGSGIFGEQICRSVIFNRLLLRATDLVLENNLCR